MQKQMSDELNAVLQLSMITGLHEVNYRLFSDCVCGTVYQCVGCIVKYQHVFIYLFILNKILQSYFTLYLHIQKSIITSHYMNKKINGEIKICYTNLSYIKCSIQKSYSYLTQEEATDIIEYMDRPHTLF